MSAASVPFTRPFETSIPRSPSVYANPTLREHVRAQVENRPGVYRMFGPGDELLYVGKSVHVRTRVLSYFRAAKGEKAWELIRETDRIEWDYIPNEFYSLIREMKLIQRWQPRFNVQHKRKRIYGFVKITAEAAPRIVPVTRVAEDRATYYGPFPRVRSVALTVRELGHVLGLRDCPAATPVFFDDQLEIFGGGRVPHCIRADLATCLAPCCGRPTAAEYHRAVELARRFLEGRAEEPLAELEQKMAAASRRMDFEYAALLRDRLERLRGFRDQLVAFRGAVEDLTFVYRVPGHRGDDRVYLIRRGRIRRELAHPKGRRARERVARAIHEVYGEVDAGPAALSAQDAAEILLVARWFRLKPKERRRTLRPDVWLAEKGPRARA
jgi:excinuclease ABC subunit C